MRPSTWRSHLAAHASDYFVTGIVALVFVFTSMLVYSSSTEFLLERQDRSEWFEYYGVTFEGIDPDARAGIGALRMASDMTVRRPLVLEFHDVLRCRAVGSADPREFVSENPDTKAFVTETYQRRTNRWIYNGDYVAGRECIVRSTITAEVDGVTKTQTIDSFPFVIGPLS